MEEEKLKNEASRKFFPRRTKKESRTLEDMKTKITTTAAARLLKN